MFQIPARNEEKYIGKTIKSILSQKLNKFVLIINDNSRDNTEKKPKKLLGMLNLLNTKLSREKNFQMVEEKFGLLNKVLI